MKSNTVHKQINRLIERIKRTYTHTLTGLCLMHVRVRVYIPSVCKRRHRVNFRVPKGFESSKGFERYRKALIALRRLV